MRCVSPLLCECRDILNKIGDKVNENAVKSESKRLKTTMNLRQFKQRSDLQQRSINEARVRWRKKFEPGTFYAPEDLIEYSFDQQETIVRPPIVAREDIFSQHKIDVAKEYKNAALLTEYVNEIGQVLPSRVTGVSRPTQKRLVKVLNRSVAFGIIPRSRKHPEMVKKPNAF
eukprot:Partr_v1_DN29017_c0_g2_i1_m58592